MGYSLPGFEDYEKRKERARRDQAEQSRKGRDVGPLPEVASEDQELVDRCKDDLKLFLETFLGAIFCLKWSEGHLRAIKTLEETILKGGQFALAMPRGNGKTSLVVGAIVWAIVYGHRRFIVAIAATGPKATEMLDSIKVLIETNELLGRCFPAACYPVRKLEGVNNRAPGQTLDGERTRITWTGSELCFPTVPNSPSSGVLLHAEGLMGSIRGKQATHPGTGEIYRPDLALLDDPQTDESAKTPGQTAKRLKVINKAVIGLAGPTSKIAVVCPCTVIQPDDLADQILDREKHPEWRGIKTRLLETMPDEPAMELWQQYREVRKESMREHEDLRDATEFYKQHHEEMKAGATVSWEERYEADHYDALQYAMDKWAKDEESFFAEYQNDPLEEAEEGIESLRKEDLLTRCDKSKRYEIPDWCETLTAFADVQQDILPYTVIAWGKDLRGRIVDYGSWPAQSQRYYTLRDLTRTLRQTTGERTVEGAIGRGLDELRETLQERYGSQLAWFGVDANWSLLKPTVYAACEKDATMWPCHGKFVGAASAPMETWKKKPRQKTGHFWRSGMENEHNIRTIDSDGNAWKSIVGKRLNCELRQGITWWGTKPYEHEMLCDQLSAEYSVEVTGRGRTVHEWKNRPGRDNHLWDCVVGCAIGASFVGVGVTGQAAPRKRKRKRMRQLYDEMMARQG